jgi:hypothetical protein
MKKPALITMLCLTLFFITPVAAQVTQEWVRLYDGSDGDGARAITTDHLGNAYICGSSVSPFTEADWLVIKYNTGGAQQWVKTYHGHTSPDYDENTCDLIHDVSGSSNDLFVCGHTCDASGDPDMTLICYNAATGSEKWIAIPAKPYIEFSCAIELTPADNLYLAGSQKSDTYIRALLLQYDRSGVLNWERYYQGPNDFTTARDMTTGFDTLNPELICVSGKTWLQIGPDHADAGFIVKYNANGTLLQEMLETDEFGEYLSVCMDDQGNVYATGYCHDLIPSGELEPFEPHDVYTVKYNASGQKLWSQRWDSEHEYHDCGNIIQVDDAGNVYVSGTTSQIGLTRFVTIKYDASGNEQWVKKYPEHPPLSECSNPSMVMDADDNIYISGTAKDQFDNINGITIKYDTNGNLIWSVQYDNTIDYFHDIALHSTSGQPNVYVTGSSYNTLENFDALTVKYSQSGGSLCGSQQDRTNREGNSAAFGFTMTMPVLINNQASIPYSVEKTGHMSLCVYDVTGKCVKTLANGYETPGTHNITWNTSKVSNGIYYLRLESDEQCATQKLVVMN